jgi:Tfp pilus assembly protein PilP
MEQAVDAAVAAAVQAPEPEEQVADAAPEADAEPEVEAVSTRIPTNASVARQATTKNALNLSRVALLGIFTSSSGRYAMIRQPGGGVKKVVVGDTIDGGDIAAISATSVEYRKGGRMVTLSLPTG